MLWFRKHLPRLVSRNVFEFTFCFMVFTILYMRGIGLCPDSNSYLSHHIIRPPLYPLFIDFVQLVSRTHYLTVLLLSQLTIGFLAAYIFCSFIKRSFKLPLWVTFVLSLFCLYPYIYQNAGNLILSEGLAYPLFLIAMRFCLEGILYRNSRSIVLAIVFSIPLVLTRGQFLFLYPVLAATLLYLFVFAAGIRAKALFLIMVFLSSIIITNLTERTYNYVLHQHFVVAPFSGVQFLTTALYVAKEDDAKLFNSPSLSRLFLSVYTKMMQQKVNQESYPKVNSIYPTYAAHFAMSYNTICWNILIPEISSQVLHKTGKPDKDDWITVNRITSSMAFTLVKANLGRFIHFYILNFISGLRSFILNVPALFSLVLIATTRNRITELFFFVSLLHFANIALVALVEAPLTRYLMYTQVFYDVLVCVLVYMAFDHHTRRNGPVETTEYAYGERG